MWVPPVISEMEKRPDPQRGAWFAHGIAVGFLLGLPNLNEALIHANGLRYPWDALRAWWALRKRPQCQCLCLKSIAVLPDYWSRGVDALMLYEMGVRAVAKGYTLGDLSITGVDNPMTVRMGSRLGARIYKRWQAYIKMLDAGEDSNMGGKDDS